MQEKYLSKISLATSFIGVCGIFILSFFVNYDLIAIGDINEDYEGKTVRVQGEIRSIIQKEQISILSIHDETGEITAILYSEETLSLQKNIPLEIIGTVSNYNCDLEIKVEKISFLNL